MSSKLLDNICNHNYDSRILPPPSFGFDNAEILPINFDKTLGYGHTGVLGSPLLTKDYCSNNIVMCLINAILLGMNSQKIK